MWISLSLKILSLLCFWPNFHRSFRFNLDKYPDQIIFKGLNVSCVKLFHSINNRYWPFYTFMLSWSQFCQTWDNGYKSREKYSAQNVDQKHLVQKIDAMLSSHRWQIFTNSKSEHETNDLKLCKIVDILFQSGVIVPWWKNTKNYDSKNLTKSIIN